jgi:serine phosphatase RsbU (regulator of sigma subunit)
MAKSKVLEALSQITDELKNFERIAKAIKPRSGSIPELDCIDVHGEIIPLNGIVGGDHLIYMDFKKRYDLDARIKQASEEGRSEVVKNLKRCQHMAGIAVIDVSGHQTTDSMLSAMVHQAFLMGALYELDNFGEITSKLFENLNTRLYRSSLVSKFVTVLYGEITANATFRFLSAAHPKPLVFSAENDKFTEIRPELFTSFPPLGTIPSEQDIDRTRTKSVLGFKSRYELNEWKLLGTGDIMLLVSDGVTEHSRGEEPYFPDRLENTVRASKGLSAEEIVEAIKTDIHDFADPSDDITIVAIKRC